MFYKEIVYRHFESALNIKKSIKPTPSALVGNPEMGFLVKLSATIEDNTIQDIAFQVYGGGAMIASMSLLMEKTKGKTIEEALLITPTMLSEELLLDSSKILYPMIAIESIHKMLQNKL